MTGKHNSGPFMFSVFRNRSFTSLWVGQLISGMGSALTALAALADSILVFRLTGSTLSVGLMLIATANPTILAGPFANIFGDCFDFKRILLKFNPDLPTRIFSLETTTDQNLLKDLRTNSTETKP